MPQITGSSSSSRAAAPIGEVMIGVMGPTGTGKSSLITLLTKDRNVIVGHDLSSQTFDITISHWYDNKSSRTISFVDTPGFDDSRVGVTDTDILHRIANFLQEKGGRKLNGIIYLHRISDPRVGGTTKKNLKVFRELCGDDALRNVRLVTTNWGRVDRKEGDKREAELRNGIFKPFIDAGAQLLRHDNDLTSAQTIISTLTKNPPVTLKIQTELNAGKALGDTSAGAIIVEEIRVLQKKHAKEIEDLKKEIENAQTSNANLRGELAAECQQLEQSLARAEKDQRRLEALHVPPKGLPEASSSKNINKSVGSRSVDSGKRITTTTAVSGADNATRKEEKGSFLFWVLNWIWGFVWPNQNSAAARRS